MHLFVLEPLLQVYEIVIVSFIEVCNYHYGIKTVHGLKCTLILYSSPRGVVLLSLTG